MNINAIKHTFIGQYLISWLHVAECRIMPLLVDDETAVKKAFRKKMGFEPDLEHPKQYSEKLNRYKLTVRDPLMAKCADKISVRDYITEKGFGDMLNEIYGVYDRVRDIDIDALPDKFVLKAAHGSHMNVIVTDKSKINWRQQKMLMSTWLKQDIAWSGREWVYKDLPKRILAEKYLEDETGELRDYKFFCFNGKPEYMEYDVGRFKDVHYRNFYDSDMNFLELSDGCVTNPDIPLPFGRETYEEMKRIAQVLAEPFGFVRVDFYCLGGKMFIGELTFFDSGGFEAFEPSEYNYIFSENWIPD